MCTVRQSGQSLKESDHIVSTSVRSGLVDALLPEVAHGDAGQEGEQ